ncbi:MAG: hypothetical protein II797_03345, partial [Clostridia bacterium]|nr:hypothetical protein [Clostridia bacterium]
MRFFQKIRENLGRILLFAALSVVALLLFLYYFGVYDLSFIERPASWNHSISDFLAPFTRKEDPVQTSEEETSGPETTGTDPATEPVTSSDPSDPGEEILYNYPSVGQMQASGYALTDKVYEPGQTVLAVLNISSVRFPLFSISKKTVSEPYFIYLTAKDEKYNNRTVAYRDVQVERPVFDLYMGYILKDNAGSIAVMNNAGETILYFKADEYLPAYTRDKAGRALFYKTVEKTVTIPEREVLQEDGVTYVTEPARDYVYQAKEYYFINEAKKRFDLSTYVDETDNRGLYFDYPAYYGTGDGSIRREVQVVERFYTDLEGNDNREVLLTWRFRNKTGNLFSRAYEYSEGRAVAEYTYTLERTNSAGETTEYTITAMQ